MIQLFKKEKECQMVKFKSVKNYDISSILVYSINKSIFAISFLFMLIKYIFIFICII